LEKDIQGVGFIMQGRKAVRTEWKIFERNGLDSREWLVQKVATDHLQIVNKATGEVKTIPTDEG
jgi:hypothetical protein